MDGKLDLRVPASSTPATSKEDYTHIRSFWLISPIQSTRSGSALLPCLSFLYMTDWLPDSFPFYFEREAGEGPSNFSSISSVWIHGSQKWWTSFVHLNTFRSPFPCADSPADDLTLLFKWERKQVVDNSRRIQLDKRGSSKTWTENWEGKKGIIGRPPERSKWIINADPNLKTPDAISGMESNVTPPHTHTREPSFGT